jgi:hypothetical protein
VLGSLAIVVALGAGCLISLGVLRLKEKLEGTILGLALGVALYLLSVTVLLQAGLSFRAAALLAPIPLLAVAALGCQWPDSPRPGPLLERWETVILLSAVVAVWLYVNMLQVITVDDDYWLHTPVQGRMLAGVVPPTNPFFPDLVLGGHFGRDTLVVSTALLTGRDVFGAQVLVTSFCHTLGLAVLYLALRRSGSAASAAAATAMVWLGVNVAHRVGLIDFFQNNGAPTYLILALLIFLFTELWRRPGRKLALVCGLVLGIYAQVYETHFGLVVLTVLSLLLVGTRQARLATLLALFVAAVLAIGGGSALTRLLSKSPAPLDEAIANQSQTVQASFPKIPFLALRIEVGEIDPISCGYRVGLGRRIFAAVDHVPKRSDNRYVHLWNWQVMRMHWLGVWLAPMSGWLLWRSRHRAGQFLWVFGAWAFLVPGMIDFGPIHEFEWFRWEFAAGFGFAGALGAALGTLVRGWRSGLAGALAVAVVCHAGLAHVRGFSQHFGNPETSEVLGLKFGSRDWLLRHGAQLRFRESDLRALAWINTNPQQGGRCFVKTTGPPEPWGILFESTAMALADIEVLGHRLPPKGEPVGVPPYRISEVFEQFLSQPSLAQAENLGINWVLLRSDDSLLDIRLAEHLRLVFFDSLAPDGRRRLLFQVGETPLKAPPAPTPSATFQALDLRPLPPETGLIEINFLTSDGDRLGSASWLPPVEQCQVAVPAECLSVELLYLDASGPLERRVVPAETGPKALPGG